MSAVDPFVRFGARAPQGAESIPARRARRSVGRVKSRVERLVRRGRSRLREGFSDVVRSPRVSVPVRRTGGVIGRVPMVRSIRESTRRAWLNRRLIRVPTEKLLLGGDSGMSATAYAEAIGDMWRPSTRLLAGPHVSLLELSHEKPEVIADDQLLRVTPYVQNALRCIEVTGHYFGAVTEAQVLRVAREFVDRQSVPRIESRPGRSPVGEPVRVRAIRHSDCFQVVDGHHRLALAATRGERFPEVALELRSVSTPLQDHLARLSWTAGRRELYQPIDAPELESEWVLVRRCDDRLALMTEFLDGRADLGLAPTYLDVGSCYSWFLAAMSERGFVVSGVELDPRAVELGELAYGAGRSHVSVGECSAWLATQPRQFDVVSCFSVLHHFALGNGPCSAEDLARRLDRATGSVLFFDTGEAHEAWFRESLPEWTPDFIRSWVLQETSFGEVVALGTDEDAIAPFAENYGRTLFACTR